MSTTTQTTALSTVVDPGEAEELNARFETAAPEEVLQWTVDRFPDDRLVLSSTFGVGGMVLIHKLSQMGVQVPIVFIDTLYHFPETLEHARRVEERFGLDLRVHRPAASREAFEAEHGDRLWETDEERFHRLTKVEPMRRALQGAQGWITGRRRDQSPTRAALPIVEVSNWIKVNPLATWSLDRVWEYIRMHDLPYNPLHDRGYASIGDEPLTTPVQAGEHERAGRWRGSVRLECGLHGI